MMVHMRSQYGRVGSAIAVLGLLGGCQLANPGFSDSLDRLLEMRDTVGTEVDGYYTPEDMADFRAGTRGYMTEVNDVTVRQGHVTENGVEPRSARTASGGNRSL